MSIKNDFENYLRLAKVYGFLCTTFDPKSSQIIVSKFDRLHEKLAATIVCIFALSSMTLFYDILLHGLLVHDVLSDRAMKIQTVIEFVIQFLIVNWIFLTRKKNLKIVREILELLAEAKNYPNRVLLGFKSGIVITLIMTINVWTINLQTRLKWLINGILTLVPHCYIYSFVFFYTFIVNAVRSLLEIFNNELENKRTNSKIEIESILLKRSALMKLVTVEFAWVYGVTMVLISAQLLVLLPSVPVVITAVIEGYKIAELIELWKIFLSTFCSIVPPLVLYSIAMVSSDLDKEANKTARILSRISKRGSGMEKMVDKFLMKNMQQKPILTAYGFFPLNKRTLFKIFAAIVTYMVILIQFKDMENTSKVLTGPKTTTTAGVS